MVSFLTIVENKVADSSDKSLNSAVASFLEAQTQILPQAQAHKTDDAADRISETGLKAWVAGMALSGLSPATRRKYLRAIHSLYKEWSHGADGNDIFTPALEIASMPSAGDNGRTEANIALIPRLLNVGPAAEYYDTVNIFLYLLFNVSATIVDVINLRFGQPVPDIPQIDDIIDRMTASRRKKYVFGLGQGKKRDGQIARDLLHDMGATLSMLGVDFGDGFSRDTVTALWIAAALKAGIAPADIRAVVSDIPDQYAPLRHILPSPLTDAGRLSVMRRVADTIHDGAPRWFVMRMRQGSTLDEIKHTVNEAPGQLSDSITYYYPTRTVIAVDKQGKKVREERPYLPGILFFRLRKDRVAQLFRSIGHLAWCYRLTNNPQSPYCVIPATQMKIFQLQVGSFTSDISIQLVSLDTPLPLESRAIISGKGMFDNQIGIIRSVSNHNGTRTYTLALSDSQYATWTVEDIEETYLTPLPH